MKFQLPKGKKRKSMITSASSKKRDRRRFRVVDLQKVVVFLLEHIPLLIVIFGISFWYIDNRYACEKKMLKITQLEKELQNRKFVWLTISAELTQLSRQSEVEKIINEKEINLKVSKTPAVKIK